MIPQGRRADYILPAYAGAALLAAWGVGEAARERGRWVLTLASVVTVGMTVGLGVYQWRWSAAAKSGEGERILALVDRAEQLADGRPIATYEVGYTPVQALLGTNDPMDERMLTRIKDGGVLITSRAAWEPIAPRFEGRARIITETPLLKESGVRLLLIDMRGPAEDP
jgi:hypothetical protein